MQRAGAFADVFGELISGKAGYKLVIEKKQEILMCKKFMAPLQIQDQKFCHECGSKIEYLLKS